MIARFPPSRPTTRPASTRTRSRTRKARNARSTGGPRRSRSAGKVRQHRLRRPGHHRAAQSASSSSSANATRRRRTRVDPQHRRRARSKRDDPRSRRGQPPGRGQRAFRQALGWRDRGSSVRRSWISLTRTTTGEPSQRSRPQPPAARPRRSSASCVARMGASRAFAWTAVPVADVDRPDGCTRARLGDRGDGAAEARGGEGARARLPECDRERRPEPPVPDRRAKVGSRRGVRTSRSSARSSYAARADRGADALGGVRRSPPRRTRCAGSSRVSPPAIRPESDGTPG